MMTRVVSVEEMLQHEKYTEQRLGVTPEMMMERVGESLFRLFVNMPDVTIEKRILVVAGIGNNGGDALVFARHAWRAGYKISVLVIGYPNENNEVYMNNLNKLDPEIVEIVTDEQSLKQKDFAADFIFDGIFGFGLNRVVGGLYAEAIRKINRANKCVIAIDIPSGISARTGEKMQEAVEATVTAIIQYYKIGNLLTDALDHSGKIAVLDIGLLFSPDLPVREKLDLIDVEPLFTQRKHRSHKYDYGNILVIGGQPGMMGAPQMAAISALRSGAGLVSVAISRLDKDMFTQIYPELMIVYYDENTDIAQLVSRRDIVVFGPGLGKNNPLADKFLDGLVASGTRVLVDADGLHYLKRHLSKKTFANRIIITPHVGEMSRLTDTDKETIEKSPFDLLDELVKKGLVVVLKGPTTIIASDEGCVFTDSGNPGMATAGSGDVLSGIIAAFACGEKSLFSSAIKGVLYHSEVGRKAREKYNEAGLTASRMMEML